MSEPTKIGDNTISDVDDFGMKVSILHRMKMEAEKMKVYTTLDAPRFSHGFRNVINPTINSIATTMIITQTQIETLLSFLSSILFTSSLFVWNKYKSKLSVIRCLTQPNDMPSDYVLLREPLKEIPQQVITNTS
jgi:hypothetical protein